MSVTLNLDCLKAGMPLLEHGDSFSLMKGIPDHFIDLVLTSPPYFLQREIKTGPFSDVDSLNDYVRVLKRFGKEVKRILKPTGSLWINIGDTYLGQTLLLVPSRVAIVFQDELGFVLRNDVIWEKRNTLPSSIKNRTTNSYEHFFHFVLGTDYYSNKTIGVRNTQTIDSKGRVISKTGITGEDYKKKIQRSDLSETEKKEAVSALEKELEKVGNLEISDFRMLLRGGTSILHKQREEELKNNGFAFIEYGLNERINDVWNVGVSKEKEHDSPFPEELLTYPILSSCPKQGIILDPFVGSGTTLVAANHLRRKAAGFEIREDYYELAKKRVSESK